MVTNGSRSIIGCAAAALGTGTVTATNSTSACSNKYSCVVQKHSYSFYRYLHSGLSETNITSDPTKIPYSEESNEIYDLICVGFGPASLAIAIALHDRGLDLSTKVLYLEKQSSFSWHAGMMLPGARMQISFIKDLATLRDPRSHFTFLNYLHMNNRLIHFINLSTFLPLREEYNDYLAWCAGHFSDKVQYNEKVTSVNPFHHSNKDVVSMFEVQSINIDGENQTRIARNVVVAVGGSPSIPPAFLGDDSRVIHSSAYTSVVSSVLVDREAPYKVAVVGAGQSAAEIYTDLHSRYPNSHTQLIIRENALKPSDDSPL